MKAILYLLLPLIVTLSLLGAYYKRLYDKEVVLHTSTKEVLVERSRELQEVSNSLDVCMFEATLSNTAIINICESNNKVDNSVSSIKQSIIEASKKTVVEGGENVKTIYNVVDTINPDIDRLLSEGWDRIYNKD